MLRAIPGVRPLNEIGRDHAGANLISEKYAREKEALPAHSRLPEELQSKFSFTSVADCVVYYSKRIGRTIAQEIPIPDGASEVRVVEQVEELSPEFKIGAFRRPEFLEH